MNVKATFPAGVNAITVNGLHQWDYGRQLEIQADGLPGLVEVHFACAGMTEAAVRVCDTSSGTAVASIPDTCLEQASPVTAWVYEVGETSGETILTITMPIIARARPKPGEVVPQPIGDKYTEAIAAMNSLVASTDAKLEGVAGVIEAEVVKGLRDGSVAVTEADHAKEADSAYDAAFAENAARATYAARAEEAESAPNVVADIENRLGNAELVPAKAQIASKLRLMVPATYSELDDLNSHIYVSLTRGYYYAELLSRDSDVTYGGINMGMFFYDPAIGKTNLIGMGEDGEILRLNIFFSSSSNKLLAIIDRWFPSSNEFGNTTRNYKIRLTQISDNT